MPHSHSAIDPRPLAYRARWVFPVHRPPIAHGIVTILNGRVVSVGAQSDASTIADLGNVALLPGLVNCHTHLEFSSLENPLGPPGRSLPEWIWHVVQFRRLQHLTRRTDSNALEIGARECWRSGTALLGEIATRNWLEYSAFSRDVPHIIKFWELLGLAPENVSNLCSQAREQLEKSHSHVRGLSPHAPYTVHPDVLKWAVDYSAFHFTPLAMHLAESREELELLATHSGPFADMLMHFNAWHPQSLIYRKPLEYLQQLSRASRVLVIHGNYLDKEEIEFLAQHCATMSVVYCPRTHWFFRHEPYPLAAMLTAGVRVAVGTDSRASNPDLSLFEELRYIAANYTGIAPEEILRMGTINGATALGMDDEYGTIREGANCHLAMANLPHDCADPHEALWNADQITVL